MIQIITEDKKLRSQMVSEQHGCPVKPRIAQDKTFNPKDLEKVTGRKPRGLQIEEICCKYQTFVSLLSSRRKQTSDFFFPSLYKFKRRFLLKYCVAIMTPGLT